MSLSHSPNDDLHAARIHLPIHDAWQVIAESKGYEIVGRVGDRLHLSLRCHDCDGLHDTRVFTLRTAQPRCPHCMWDAWEDDAADAGLTLLGRDYHDRHVGIYRAGCGHVLHRQFSLIRDVALGNSQLRCETCLEARLADEAARQGWQIVGATPDGAANYRSYRHHCGHERRVTVANMRNGRVACAACEDSWMSKPSALYLMVFRLGLGRRYLKLGYSSDPELRLRQRLLRDPDATARVLRTVRVRDGRTAVKIEKRLHATLRASHPDCVVPPDEYAAIINVGSEVYDARLEPQLHACLDAVAAEVAEALPEEE